MTAMIWDAYDAAAKSDHRYRGAVKPQDGETVFCENVLLYLDPETRQLVGTVEPTEECDMFPRDANLTITNATIFTEQPDGNWTETFIKGILVRSGMVESPYEPIYIFYNTTDEKIDWAGIERCELNTTNEPPPAPAGGGGARRRLLQAPANPSPETPPPGTGTPPGGGTAPGPSGNNSDVGLDPNPAHLEWGVGNIGLYTNTPPPVTEYLTVERIDVTHFYLVAPNSQFLVVDKTDGTISATSPNRGDATVFNATQVEGGRAIQLGTSDGLIVGWGSSNTSQCDGANNPIVARSSPNFQQDYSCEGAKAFSPEDYITWNVREVTKVPRIRGVNLGGWLVLEEWMTPDLYTGVPDLVDGWQIQLQSPTNGFWLSGRNPRQVDCSRAEAKNTEVWAVSRVNGAATMQIRLRMNKVGRYSGYYLRAPKGSGGAVFLSPVKDESEAMSDVFNVTLSGDSTQLILQSVANEGKCLAVQSNGDVLANENMPADFSGRCVFTINRLANFDGMKTVQGEYQISAFATDAITKVPAFRQSFIQESDWAFMAQMGINTVRIPVGYWIAQGAYPDPPFIAGGDAILDQAFVMAEKYNIRIWLSMHSARGGQNYGAESSSRDGVIDWDTEENIDNTLNTTAWLANRYAKSPAFFAIGLLNEPAAEVNKTMLMDYYMKAYKIVREYSPSAYVGIMPTTGNDLEFKDFMSNPLEYTNIVYEVHYYPVFDGKVNTNPDFQAQIQYVLDKREEMRKLEKPGRTLLIGEWSLALAELVNAGQKDYKTFSQVQMHVYNLASAGWFHWSYKVGDDSTGFPNWSMVDAYPRGWLMYY